jgi:hypothetical protein
MQFQPLMMISENKDRRVILGLTTATDSRKRTGLISIDLCRVNMTPFQGAITLVRMHEAYLWDHTPVSSGKCRDTSIDCGLSSILVYAQT